MTWIAIIAFRAVRLLEIMKPDFLGTATENAALPALRSSEITELSHKVRANEKVSVASGEFCVSERTTAQTTFFCQRPFLSRDKENNS